VVENVARHDQARSQDQTENNPGTDVAPRHGLPGVAVHTLSESSNLQGFGIKLPARREATTTERIL
jgi:hypothetical protein